MFSLKIKSILILIALSTVLYLYTSSIPLTIIMVIFFIILFLQWYGKKNNSTKKELIQKEERHISYEDNIPSNYYIWEDDSYYVRGTQYRYKSVLKWLESSTPQSELFAKRELDNIHDNNAIAIYGVVNNKKIKLGYLPAEEADEIVYQELDKNLKLNLLSAKSVPSKEDISAQSIIINYEILIKE